MDKPIPVVVLEELIDKFSSVQRKYAQCGAEDTEPDGIFQKLLYKAATGKLKYIPITPDEWELYDMPLSYTAAIELHDAAKEVISYVSSLKLGEAACCVEYLQSYCWRLSWE